MRTQHTIFGHVPDLFATTCFMMLAVYVCFIFLMVIFLSKGSRTFGFSTWKKKLCSQRWIFFTGIQIGFWYLGIELTFKLIISIIFLVFYLLHMAISLTEVITFKNLRDFLFSEALFCWFQKISSKIPG